MAGIRYQAILWAVLVIANLLCCHGFANVNRFQGSLTKINTESGISSVCDRFKLRCFRIRSKFRYSPDRLRMSLGSTVIEMGTNLLGNHWIRDASCSTMGMTVAMVWIAFWGSLARNSIVDARVSRRAIHIGSGPLLLALWPLFSNHPTARIFAAIIPAMSALAILAAAPPRQAAAIDSPSTVTSVGDEDEPFDLDAYLAPSEARNEAMKGPLYYAVALLVLTLCGWRSPPTIAAACAMAAAYNGAHSLGARARDWLEGVEWPLRVTVNKCAAVSAIAFTTSLLEILWFRLWGAIPNLAARAYGFQMLWVAIASSLVNVLQLGGEELGEDANARMRDYVAIPLLAFVVSLAVIPPLPPQL